MIAMSLRIFIIKILVFIFIKPPLYKWLEVDTQITEVPKLIISNICSCYNIFNTIKE